MGVPLPGLWRWHHNDEKRMDASFVHVCYGLLVRVLEKLQLFLLVQSVKAKEDRLVFWCMSFI